MNFYYTLDFRRWSYYCYSNHIIGLDNGECCENDVYHPPFYYYNKESYGYMNISDDDDREEEEENLNDDKDDSYFEYFDFDFIFQTIIETNNYLALFLLFDHGMNNFSIRHF